MGYTGQKSDLCLGWTRAGLHKILLNYINSTQFKTNELFPSVIVRWNIFWVAFSFTESKTGLRGICSARSYERGIAFICSFCLRPCSPYAVASCEDSLPTGSYVPDMMGGGWRVEASPEIQWQKARGL